MRVITGKARGVQLKTPEGMLTRPTADKVKEALFSIIQFEISSEERGSWELRPSAGARTAPCLWTPGRMPAS